MDSVLTATSADGTTIGFRRSGTGPPLILVHGATAEHTRWAPVLPALEQHFTVYAMDRRGRGLSGDSDRYAVEREFEDIVAVVESIEEPVYLLGHSFGAYCTLEAALRTDRIRRLILYEPPPPGVGGTIPDEVADMMEEMLKAGDRDGVVSIFLSHVAQIPSKEIEVLRSLPAWPERVAAAHTILREIQHLEAFPPFAANRFSRLNIPVLHLLGGDSHPLYSSFIRELDQALPNSNLVVMPGQQHVAMNTAPEMFTGYVVDFLTEE